MSTIKQDKKLLDNFFVAMMGKLRVNRHKKVWTTESLKYLMERLKEEVKELEDIIKTKHYSKIALECTDVANYAAMIFDKVSLCL